MKRTRPVVWIGVGLLVIVGLLLLLRPGSVPVELGVVTKGPLQVTVEEEGETRVKDRYVVTAPVAGRVLRSELREGDTVRRGSVVGRMYPAPIDARARQQAAARLAGAEDAGRAAAAAVIQARSALSQAQREVRRAEELGSLGLIAPEELERVQLTRATRERELESADFRAQAAGHDVDVARAALVADAGRPLLLRAPVGGMVLRIPERSERVVAVGESLLELGDPARLEVVVDLLSADAVTVACGAPLVVSGWGGGELTGRVRRVEPSGFTKVSALGVEEQRVNVIGEIDEPPAALGDRFRVEVRIVIWQSAAVLRAPASAVFRSGQDWAVFVMDEGRARLRLLQLGHRTPFEVEVQRGLEAGDRVILNPSDRIVEGTRIRVRDT
jgi:HlyD family secretion protein